ncbi:FAM105 [Trinorchestia longiramus]|nr:FAM105 [Trinorchestia longiramus]
MAVYLTQLLKDLRGKSDSSVTRVCQMMISSGQSRFGNSSCLRAGSVVLLVGVGSLVCWRLWAHWRYRGDDDTSLDSPKSSPNTTPKKADTSSRRFGLLASLLEEELVQEAGEEGEDEDPAFIQLLRVLKETLFDLQPGRYFGPDGSEYKRGLEPVGLPVDVSTSFSKKRSERAQLLGTPPCDVSSCSGSSAATPSDQLYHADHSSSASSRDKENVNSSSGGEDSAAESRAAARSRRRRRRLCRTRGSEGERRTSESRVADARDGSQDSARETELHKRCHFANPGTDDECSTDVARDECEGVWNGAPYSDLLERMRSRQARRSLSREPSVCSNLSDVLMSPNSSQCRLPFMREDSVCSNLSDFTVSECSELSMDMSVKEEVNNTFRHLQEIEQDLDDLKTSVLQMDEEVAQFVTKPDPYSLKMTFSDYSLSSREDNDSLPHLHDESSSLDDQKQLSAAEESSGRTSRNGLQILASPGSDNNRLAVPGSLVVSKKLALHVSDTEAEASLEWDSPRHGWSSSVPVLQNVESTSQKDETLVSLEWDDGGVKQHPEPAMMLRRSDSAHNFHDNATVGSQLLPDYSALELDLELELTSLTSHLPSIGPNQCRASPTDQRPVVQSTFSDEAKVFGEESKAQNISLMTASTDSAIVTSMTASGMSSSTISELTSSVTAVMEGSTDSAIYSAPGSRSATASPVPSSFLQPTMSSAGFSSCGRADACRRVEDEVRHRRSGRLASAGDDQREESNWRSSSRWSSEESGFAEPDSDGPTACLSPVSELRERSESSSSSSNRASPEHRSSLVSNLRDAATRYSSQGLNLLLSNSDDADRLNGNLSQCHTPVTLHNKINNSLNATASSVTNDTNTENISPITPWSPPIENCSNTTSADTNRLNARFDADSVNANLSAVGNSISRAVRNSNGRGGVHERTLSPASRHVVAVGERMDLMEYCDREWRGNTQKANAVRMGYGSVENIVGLKTLRSVRGDQYCAVRAAIFQALTGGITLPRSAPTLARLLAEVAGGASWILQWSFANRLHYGSTIDGIRDCLETLDNVSDGLIGHTDRSAALVQLLNNDERLDLQLCEAVKLHMLASALQLYSVNICGGNVPLFAMIIFARETSESPEELLRNHLNSVGDTGGLEQIEMFLLGHCLKATLQVVRPASYGAEDFVCYYPDTHLDEWPQLSLIAEDDRHYNVLVE